ncbi:Dihydroorotate dehydrogenase B (NAD(+)), electron transfer subunit [Pontiella desulfatans]|uniref:Dihydroorotate dehydrogenase B (NAD(+)), electron transfer subunit n=1 Tax=Pontiella desulfatans TaxID=2750659 RepID=A0A6C2U8U7_PONDE|nr:dihydroorotate dehydrogenase electron transfer subunit [Pontiella desulfatans]VGO15921.1 Dihydroorotate dehydrogenase B (NAD(+)), electron transfer subunit [Pontiella desulfatans]
MKQEKATVVEHHNFQGEYRILRLAAPVVGPLVKPGQFLELQVPRLDERILRRPFSIYQADAEGVAVLYKAVGRGTEAMAAIQPGDEVDIIGSLGNGYPEADANKTPVLVAGGYGNAALYILAQRMEKTGIAFFGGRSEIDILLVKEFEALGWEVRPTTDDGTLGTKGLVTAAFDPWMKEQEIETLELFVCGPNPMLKAMGDRAIANKFTAWLSLDRNMACGVGACLTCVIKRKTGEGWEWARCCKDGPIFESREILWNE